VLQFLLDLSPVETSVALILKTKTVKSTSKRLNLVQKNLKAAKILLQEKYAIVCI